MSYNLKNYNDKGGDRTVIKGELVITEGGKLFFYDQEIKPAERQETSTASTVAATVSDLNSLIEKLKAAGLMARK